MGAAVIGRADGAAKEHNTPRSTVERSSVKACLQQLGAAVVGPGALALLGLSLPRHERTRLTLAA